MSCYPNYQYNYGAGNVNYYPPCPPQCPPVFYGPTGPAGTNGTTSMVRYEFPLAYNNIPIISSSYTQILIDTEYTWTGACGISPTNAYRITFSWAGENIADDVAYYIEINNNTQIVTYSGSTYTSITPAIGFSRSVPGEGQISGGSISDIFTSFNISVGNKFYVRLYMRPLSGSHQFGQFNANISIEPTQKGF
jgi:hypothetical protein